MRDILKIEFKILWQDAFWAMLVLLVLVVISILIAYGPSLEYKVVFCLELAFPLFGGMSAAHILLVDRKEGAYQFVYATNVSRLRLLARRLGLLLGINIVIGSLAIVGLSTFCRFANLTLWLSMAGNLIFFTGLSLGMASLFRSNFASYIVLLLCTIFAMKFTTLIPQVVQPFGLLHGYTLQLILQSKLILALIGSGFPALSWSLMR